jgi:hypothetical protein
MPYIGNPIYQSAFVVDQFSGNGSTTAFTMSVAPAGVTNVLVAVSGVLQDPSTYGVVGNTITFSAAPPSGTGNISCRYLGVPVTGVTTTAYRTVTEFTATASQTTFTPPSYTVGFINVYLNGVLLGSADYTATNGTTVVLATGASAGNLVTVESFLVSSVLNALPLSGGTLSGNLIVNGTETISGNLGIGTTSPSYALDARSASAPAIRLSRSGSAGQIASMVFEDGTATLGTGNTTRIASDSGAMSFSTGGTSGAVTGGTERMRLNTTGALILQGGNASANGVGITFPATQSASSDANTLDDYEEGTWTPNQGAGLTVVGAFSSVGYYTKIGNIVTVNGYVKGGTSISIPATASLICTNLPFASNTAGIFWTGSMLNWNADSSGVCAAQQNLNNLYAGNVIAASDRISFEFSYRV